MTRTRVVVLFFFCWAACATSPVPAAPPAPTAEQVEAIAKATANLSSSRFIIRERGMRQLWEIGLAAKPTLQRLVADGDAETRVRAGRVLQDFQFGVLPTTPHRLRQLIGQFRDGQGKQRLEAIAALRSERATSVIENLTSLEPDLNLRVIYLMQLTADPLAADDYRTPQQLVELVQRVGADQDVAWRRSTIASLIFSPASLATRTIDEFRQIDEFMAALPPADRSQYLALLASDSRIVEILVQAKRHAFVFQLLRHEADPAIRNQLASRLFMQPRVMRALAERDTLIDVINMLPKHADAATQQQFLSLALMQSEVIAATLSRMGLDGLLQLSQRIEDPQSRVRAVATLIANRAVIAQLKSDDNLSKIVNLAVDEPDDALRLTYLKVIVKANVLNLLAANDAIDTVKVLWQRIEASQDEALRHDAVLRLVRIPDLAELIDDPASAKSLLEMIGTLDVSLLPNVLPILVHNDALLQVFHDNSLIDELIAIHCKVADPNQSRLLIQLTTKLGRLEADLQRRLTMLFEIADQLDAKERLSFLIALGRGPMPPKTSQALVSRIIRESTNENRDSALQAIVSTRTLLQSIRQPSDVQWVVDGLPKLPEELLATLASAIYRDQELRQAFLQGGHIETLVVQFCRLDPRRYSSSISRLLDSAEAKAMLADRDALMRLLELSEQRKESEVKLQLFKTIAASESAMRQLLGADQLDRLLGVIQTISPAHQADAIAVLTANPTAAAYLVQHDRLGRVLRIVDGESHTPDLEQIVNRLFAYTVVAAIEKESRFDKVAELLQSDLPPAVVTALANQMLTDSRLRRGFAKQDRLFPTFDVAVQGDGLSYAAGRSLVSDKDSVQAFFDAMRLDALLEAVLAERNDLSMERRSQGLFASSALLNLLLKADQVDVLYRLVRSQPDADDKSTFLQTMLRNRYTVSRLVSEDQFAVLWELIENEATSKRQPLLQSLLLIAALDDIRDKSYAAEISKLEAVYVNVDRMPKDAIRHDAILAWAAAPLHRYPEGHIAHVTQVARWIDQQVDPRLRTLWGTRLTGAIGPATIIAAGRTDLLANLIDGAELNKSTVAMLTTQPKAVEALHQAKLLDRLIEACERSPQKGVLRSALLQSAAVLSRLDLETQVRPWLKELFKADNNQEREATVRSVCAKKHLLRVAIDEGHFETLADWIKQAGGSSTNRSPGGGSAALFGFLSNPICIAALEREKRGGELLKALTEVRDPRQQYRLLHEGIHLQAALDCIARNGGLGSILQILGNLPPPVSATLIDRHILLPNKLAIWVDNAPPSVDDKLVESLIERQNRRFVELAMVRPGALFRSKRCTQLTFRILESVPQSTREQFTMRIVTNPSVRWQLLEYGQYELLISLIDPLAAADGYKQDLVYGSAGLVAHHIANGRLDDAERLLVKHTDNEIGKSELAAFWLQRGILPQRIADFQDKNLPLLPFLLGCNQQTEQAARWARQRNDVALANWIDAGPRRLDRVVEQQQRIVDGLAVVPAGDETQRLNMLWGLATYQHLAGRSADCDKTFEQIEKLAVKINRPLTYVALVNCLLFSDRIDRAMEIARDHAPGIDFELRRCRGEYDAALQSVAWTPDDPAGWVAKRLKLDQKQPIPLGAIPLAANVAWILDQTERGDQADAIYAAMVAKIGAPQSNNTNVFYPNRVELARVMRTSGRTVPVTEPMIAYLKRIGRHNMYVPGHVVYKGGSNANLLKPLGLPLAQEFVQADASEPISEFDGWWSYFVGPSADRVSDPELIQRLHNTLALLAAEGMVVVDGQSRTVDDYLASELESMGDRVLTMPQLTAFVELMLRLNQPQQAYELMQQQQQRGTELPEALAGMIYRRLQKWPEAATAFQAAWESDVEQLHYRYLAAEAVMRGGDREAGTKLLQTASLMAVNYRVRVALVHHLRELGAKDLADDEARVLQVVAPIGSYIWYNDCKWLADLESDPTIIADLLQASMMRYAGGWSLEIPVHELPGLHEIHLFRATAAIDDSDYGRAQHHIDRILALNRTDPQIGERLVPLLQAAGRQEQAEALQRQLIPPPTP